MLVHELVYALTWQCSSNSSRRIQGVFRHKSVSFYMWGNPLNISHFFSVNCAYLLKDSEVVIQYSSPSSLFPFTFAAIKRSFPLLILFNICWPQGDTEPLPSRIFCTALLLHMNNITINNVGLVKQLLYVARTLLAAKNENIVTID
jgi:hypothetical protein